METLRQQNTLKDFRSFFMLITSYAVIAVNIFMLIVYETINADNINDDNLIKMGVVILILDSIVLLLSYIVLNMKKVFHISIRSKKRSEETEKLVNSKIRSSVLMSRHYTSWLFFFYVVSAFLVGLLLLLSFLLPQVQIILERHTLIIFLLVNSIMIIGASYFTCRRIFNNPINSELELIIDKRNESNENWEESPSVVRRNR